LLHELRPRVVVNTASAQGGRVAAVQQNDWTRFVQAGGLGVTAILQARLSLAVSRAVAAARPEAHFVNCCYPDVVNGMIAGAGLPIACGIGNVAILAHAFAGVLASGSEQKSGPERNPGPAQGPTPGHEQGHQQGGRLHVLAQHAALAAFRRAAGERAGKTAPRVWLDGRELDDVHARFAAVQLSPESAIDISGASGVPLFVAMVAGEDWRGHVPGPGGLPGGYPVVLRGGEIRLDLPMDLTREAAIAWNAAFEARDGVVVEADGQVRYTGNVEAVMRAASPALAAGFAMRDFAAADHALTELRARLSG
jgi:hypothetical protein